MAEVKRDSIIFRNEDRIPIPESAIANVHSLFA